MNQYANIHVNWVDNIERCMHVCIYYWYLDIHVNKYCQHLTSQCPNVSIFSCNFKEEPVGEGAGLKSCSYPHLLTNTAAQSAFLVLFPAVLKQRAQRPPAEVHTHPQQQEERQTCEQMTQNVRQATSQWV